MLYLLSSVWLLLLASFKPLFSISTHGIIVSIRTIGINSILTGRRKGRLGTTTAIATASFFLIYKKMMPHWSNKKRRKRRSNSNNSYCIVVDVNLSWMRSVLDYW